VSRLLRSRRIARAFANADRRRSVLKLTRSGEGVYWRVVPFARRYERALLAPLSNTERTHLDRLLSRLQRRAVMLGPIQVD
jgi:DNA-binding MarR family transcriptional regulator